MMGWFALLLGLLGAGVILWWFQHRHREHPGRRLFTQDYFIGLNYLLNEQEDKAVAVFIKLLEVDGDTVETHLALGSLFRRRGEVDRAIRIHQNLIARPNLTTAQRQYALLALGRDYLNAGMLDRAEKVFKELSLGQGDWSIQALQYLLDIYQQEKAWQQAIEAAKRIEVLTGHAMQNHIAHYYCELSEQAMLEGQLTEVKRWLTMATQYHKTSVRAGLLTAQCLYHQEYFQDAVAILKKTLQISPHYVTEIIPLLIQCYQHLNEPDAIVEDLQWLLPKFPESVVNTMLMHRGEAKWLDQMAVVDLLKERVAVQPSLQGMAALLRLIDDRDERQVIQLMPVLSQVASTLVKTKAAYQCIHCGFSGKYLHWQCPGCKRWDVIQPIAS